MPQFRLVLLVIALLHHVVTGSLAQHSDGVDERLKEAKANYSLQNETARKRMLDAYAETLKALSAADRMQESAKVAEDMKAFEQSGILLGTPGMQRPTSEYCRAIKIARESLAFAYDTAIKQLTVSGRADRAGALLKESSDLALKSRLVSITLPNRRNLFLQHGRYLLWAKPMDNEGSRLNATFELVPGLANGSAVSFRVVNVPEHFLAHRDFRLLAVRFDPGDGFRQNATFRQVKGLASANSVSFEAFNFPGYFIRVRKNGEIWVDKDNGSAVFRSEATFQLADPQYRLW